MATTTDRSIVRASPACEPDSRTEYDASAANAAADQLLMDLALSLDAGTPMTIEDVVARIRAIPPNPANIRRAEPGLADVLRRRDESGVPFDQAAWDREWQAIEAEINRLSD